MNKQQHGFTIVELLIVVVVIAILAAITIVAYNGIQSRSRLAALQSGLVQAAKKLEVEKNSSDINNYPSSLASAGISTPANITYNYQFGSTTYCLSGTSAGVIFRVTDTNLNPTQAPCFGDVACLAGYIVVPGSSTYGTSDFCIMKYEAKNIGGVATSQAAGSPWATISQINAVSNSSAACSGCHLTTKAEWLTLAQNVLSVAANWSGGAVGSGYIYSGHNDNAPFSSLGASTDNDGYSGTGSTSGNQRRTLALTNGEVVWDLAGNVAEFTQGITTTGQPGLTGESSFTWKEWTDVTAPGTLSPNLSPTATGLASASSWNSLYGIGRLHSNAGETTARVSMHGGAWYDANYAGVLTVHLGNTPSYFTSSVGFRVAR